MNRLEAADFERIYARSTDPWSLASSDYERRKRDDTITALEGRRYVRGLEIGCSIGVLSARLGACCGSLLAIDCSPTAVAHASARLAGRRNVRVRCASFPEEAPPGRWDLIVCSEVLYYLDHRAFERALAWLRVRLAGGATVLAVHWRGPGATEPLRGDEVHDRMREQWQRWHRREEIHPSYRLDRFDGATAARPRRSGRLAVGR